MPNNTLILGSLASSGSLYTQDSLLFGKFSDATNFEVDSFINNTSGSLSFDFTNDRFSFNKPVSASNFYGDGSNLTGVSSDPFPFTGSAEISGSLIIRDADTTLRGTLNVKGEGSDTSILKIGGNVNSGGSVRLDFKHHTTENNAGASIRSSGGSYGTGNLQFYAKGTNTSDGADLTSDNLIAKMSYTNGLEVYKNFSVLGGDLQFGHVGNNTSAEKRLGVRTDEPNSTQSSLHIEAGQATYSNRSGGNLRLKAGGGSGTGNSGVVSFFTCTGSLASGEENTVLERARFTPNGDFGIGTTSPSEKLTVEGNISSSREIIGIINGGSF